MVAIDSDVDQLLQYHSVEPVQVRDLVHGTIFTRGVGDLKNTAIFVGGSDVTSGENLMQQVTKTFFGPMQVSVMMDANGSNTTAAAAVVAAGRHLDLSSAKTLVLGGTGPVGQRVARLLAVEGASIRVASRKLDRAQKVCDSIAQSVNSGKLEAVGVERESNLVSAMEGVTLVVACGAAGIELLPADVRMGCSTLKVAIDLNAVPPLGIEGVNVMDKAAEQNGCLCYGAIGVGGTKMKIHKESIRRLFGANDLVLDAEEIYKIGCELENA